MNTLTMRRSAAVLGVLAVAAVLGGCPSGLTFEVNSFLTYLEEYSATGRQQDSDGSGGSGQVAGDVFRRPLTLTFQNAHTGAVLETRWVAWVSVSSVRSADQQDALLAGGYVQLTREVRLGTAYALPAGTFVYDGPGPAGSTSVLLAQAAGEGEQGNENVTPTEISFDLITPDRILVFSQPPVSCDSVAFTYTDPIDRMVLEGPSTGPGGYKTLAQVDVYICDPLQPGLVFSPVVGAGANNQYREGDPITFTFLEFPTADGDFAIVTIGEVDIDTGGQ